MLSVALFVTGGSLGLAYYLSLEHLLVTAPPENIIVVSKGAGSEIEGSLELESARKLELLDGIKREGDPLAARELVAQAYLAPPNYKHYEAPRTLRGIDADSVAVHRVTLVQGVAPAAGSLEVIVGKRLAARFKLAVGGALALPAGSSKIVGVFDADGSSFEDEVWTPRAALELHSKLTDTSSVTIVAQSVGGVPDLIDRINANKDLDAHAATVAAYRSNGAGLATIARTVLVLLVLLATVATFVIAMTMNAAVLLRMAEFGSLAAIGIRRGVLARIVLVESALLGVIGAVVGMLASLLIANRLGAIPLGANPVELAMPAIVIVVGLALGVMVGVIGGVVPALQVSRLNVLEALRS